MSEWGDAARPRPVRLDDLRSGVRVRHRVSHRGWDATGTIFEDDHGLWLRWDPPGSGAVAVGPEEPVYPGDLDIISGPAGGGASRRPLTMQDLKDGVPVRHTGWGNATGKILKEHGRTYVRFDRPRAGSHEVSPEGPVHPGELEILGGGAS